MNATPLAERMRPQTLDDLVGQEHLAGKGSILRTAIEHGKIPSMILWGPPGTGKTTIANIIAHTLNVPFFTLSAISAGVKEVREVIQQALKTPATILRARRFCKSQITYAKITLPRRLKYYAPFQSTMTAPFQMRSVYLLCSG